MAHYMGLPPRDVRRKPLALVLLWLNYAAQCEGLETWWPTEVPACKGAEEVRGELDALRQQAEEIYNLQSTK